MTVAGFLDDLLDRDQHRRIVTVPQEHVELAEGFGGGVPAFLGAIA
jgi:hypothetical protein